VNAPRSMNVAALGCRRTYPSPKPTRYICDALSGRWCEVGRQVWNQQGGSPSLGEPWRCGMASEISGKYRYFNGLGSIRGETVA